MSDPVTSLKPEAVVVGGRWEIVRPLAKGGMGTLYVARHRITGRIAALKVLEARFSDEGLAERFRREARSTAEINHPGIVEVLDADRDAQTGTCFLAMELLEGQTLREIMNAPDVTPERILRLMSQVLEPLAAAHEKGFVHRDLKPENIFIVQPGTPKERVKLLDFGIARQATASRMTQTGTAMGTPHYMSPEQAVDAGSVCPASDVWSVGVMIYEAIAGRPPFDGESVHGVVLAACTQDQQPLVALIPTVEPALSALVDRCLSKRPVDRPQTADELRHELEKLLGNCSLPASRPASSWSPPELNGIVNTSGVRPRSGPPSVATTVAGNFANLNLRKLAVGVSIAGTVLVVGLFAIIVLGVASGNSSLLGAAPLLGSIGAVLAVLSILGLRLSENSPGASSSALAKQGSTKPAALDAEKDQHGSPSLGIEEAPVTVVLFGDLVCPQSRRAMTIIRSLMPRYGDDVRLVFRNLPPQEDGAPWLVAEAAREAFVQLGNGAFWAMLERVDENKHSYTRDALQRTAQKVGLDVNRFRGALRGRVHRKHINSEREIAKSLGATRSPVLFVNGRLVLGARSTDAVTKAIEETLTELGRRPETSLPPDPTAATQVFDNDVPARMGLRHILVRWAGAREAPSDLKRSRGEAKVRAGKLVWRARLGDTEFENLGWRFGDASGDLGYVTVAELPSALQTAAVRLKVDDISDVIETKQGFQILQRYA